MQLRHCHRAARSLLIASLGNKRARWVAKNTLDYCFLSFLFDSRAFVFMQMHDGVFTCVCVFRASREREPNDVSASRARGGTHITCRALWSERGNAALVHLKDGLCASALPTNRNAFTRSIPPLYPPIS